VHNSQVTTKPPVEGVGLDTPGIAAALVKWVVTAACRKVRKDV
jgi:hypothetical protein